jgi:MSHA biogenesis protein MshQ
MWTDDTAGSGSCGPDPNYNSGTQSLEVSVTRSAGSPASNAPIIGFVDIPDDTTGTIPVVLDFSVAPGQASFSLLTTDVGQYRLNMTDTPNASSYSDVNIVGISNELTVRPFGLAVTSITGLIPNPGNTTSAGAVFALAGADFSATVEAVLWDSNDDTNNDGVLDTGVYADNQKAPGYAWATTLGVPSPAMGFTPTAGAQNGVQGSFINGALVAGDFTAGTASPANLQYDEVGSFTLQSSATGYLGTPGADFVGDDIIVGRFRPASFALTSTVNGMFANSCTPGLSPYTYIGESFTYDVIHPSFVVTAMNGLAVPTPTTNYTGAWGKLDDDSVSFTQPVADLTQDGSDGSTKMAISYTQDVAEFTITDNTDGSYSFEFANDSYVYDKDSNSEIPDFDSDISLAVIDITDQESVTYNTAFNLNPTFINLRFGRVRMINAHGSELSDLTMPMQVEYLDSPGLYTINSDDDCTTIATVGISDNLSTPGSSTVTVTNTTAVGGDLGVLLTAPGADITGYIDVTPDLTASLDSWLKYDWTVGAGAFTENPTARATFGIYTGNDVNIYKSQTYQ